MRYKTIFLDWDGTLSVSRFWQHWAIERPDAYAAIQRHLFGSNMVEPWMRGRYSAEERVATIAPKLGLAPALILKELTESCRRMTLIDPEVSVLIAALRSRGVSVVIATDNMDTFRRWTMPALGLDTLVDDVLDSHTLGYLKRDIASDGRSLFFGSYLASAGLKSGESVLLDDGAHNRVVQTVGIDFIQLEHGRGLIPALKSL